MDTLLLARSNDGRVGATSVVADMVRPGELVRPAGAAWSRNDRVEDGASPDDRGPKAAGADGIDARATSTAIDVRAGPCAAVDERRPQDRRGVMKGSAARRVAFRRAGEASSAAQLES